MRTLLCLALASTLCACKKEASPEAAGASQARTDGAEVVLGLAEIQLVDDDGVEQLRVHADGRVQVNRAGTWTPLGTLSADGSWRGVQGEIVGQLSPDGHLSFRGQQIDDVTLEGEVLQADDRTITIDAEGRLQGVESAQLQRARVVGADTPETRRTALLVMASFFLLVDARRETREGDPE